MSKAIYPGSFDPITNGHLDIIKRASKVFDKIVVAIMYNPNKKMTFSIEERIELIKECTKDIDNIEIITDDGLTINLAKKIGANVIVRGIRAVVDYEYELQIATTNMVLDKNIETLFFAARSEYSFLSSSVAKEIAMHGGDISKFIPIEIKDKVTQKFK